MKQRPKILLVDDDADLVAVMKGALESKAYEVIAAYNGKEGLEKAKKEKPLLGERPMATLGEAALETGKMLATLPYRAGEAISETAIMPPEGVTRGEALAGTAAEIAARSETGARKLLGGLQETILSEIDNLAERFQYLQKSAPHLIVADPVFGETLCEVPANEITKHYKPAEKLANQLIKYLLKF
jgi:CheY-like chemotaxis protein